MRSPHFGYAVLGAVLLALSGEPATATSLMPSFASVPSGWVVDRYAPDSFSNVGTYQGRSDVLGIGIGPNGSVANRPSAYSSQFYDTQGMQYSVSGGSGSTLSADLYLPGSWLASSNGAVRTDMWGVMTDGSSVSDYPIIGFTNQSPDGYVGFRVWDDTLNSGAGGWVELGTTGLADSWNSLSIDFTGTDFLYELNGTLVYDQSNTYGSIAFQALIMQAYNFDDAANFPNAVITPYVAHWSNAVPEPITLSLFGAGLAGLVAMRRRKRVA